MPDNFCFESLERVKIKLPDTKIRLFSYDNLDAIRVQSKDTNVLLIVHYNAYDRKTAARIPGFRKSGFIVIEDFTHAAFEIKKARANFSFASLRKVLPISASVTYAMKGPQREVHAKSAFLRIKNLATVIKTLVLKNRGYASEELYLELFRLAEKQLYNSKIQPANTAEIQLLRRLNIERALEVRLRNFRYLKRSIRIKGLVSKVYPGNYSYFIIGTKNQGKLRKHFFVNGIFPAIHWAEGSSREGSTTLSLHIDHRFNVTDMRRIKDILDSYVE